MEVLVFRVLLLVILFILLTGDYTTFFSYFLQKGTEPTHRDASRTTSKSHDGDDTDGTQIEDALDLYSSSSWNQLMSTIKYSCLPKLICELNASPHKGKLTDSEKSLLSLIRDTSISVTAEVTSKYHFAAHMGQLIAGVDGAGCHNFYPACPFPGLQVLHMMKKVKIR